MAVSAFSGQYQLIAGHIFVRLKHKGAKLIFLGCYYADPTAGKCLLTLFVLRAPYRILRSNEFIRALANMRQ